MPEIGNFDYNEEEDEMPLSSQQEDLPKLTGPSPWERAIAAAEAVAARYEGQEDENY